MRKKLVSMLLASAMVCSLLAGCGGKEQETQSNQTADEAGGDAAEESGAAEGDTAGDEAAVGELTTQSVIDKGVVDLRLIFYGDMTTRRDEFFKKEFHDRVLEDLNINLTVETLPWGSESTVATMLTSGEKFALYNNGYNFASKGYLAPISQDMIDALLPDLKKARGENNGFECVKFKDVIYTIPFGNKPYSGGFRAFNVRNDILSACGYEADDIHTYDELMKMLEDVHKQYPSMRIMRSSGFLAGALAPVLSENVFSIGDRSATFACVDEVEEGDKVYSYYETDAFKNLCKTAAEWAQLGYIQADEVTNPTAGQAEWEAGNTLVCYGTPAAYISTIQKTVNPAAEEKLVVLDGTVKLKGSDYDWGFAISAADAEHTDRWLTLFNWMYQNQENYNFCVYGVEGKDWEYNEDGTIKKLCTDSFIDGWFMEAIPYNIYDPSISQECIDKYINWDNDSVMSKSSGFAFDPTPVATEEAMLTAVFTELLQPMSLGLLDFDENYDEALKQLKEAGLDEYVAEYQKQFSEWYAAK